jgi:CDP-glucose 4,6-dehydratase
MEMIKSFKDKKVLITGHTGFKGSWLTLWMKLLGAKVMGCSYGKKTTPSNFDILKLKKKINSKSIDVRNFNSINKCIHNFKPDYIFHLAAEAIVKTSYQFPRKTWETNTLGTINILDSLRNYKKNVIVVIITSDKVYKNIETRRGYKENDELGNFDPYSASKSSADIAAQSFIKSFLIKKKNIKIAVARAGNVIGGGDWAKNRLIPDCIRSWKKNQAVLIRNPSSTRPWQHVLDILNGYIMLAINLKKNSKINGETFNFGPKIEQKSDVLNVVKLMRSKWKNAKLKIESKKKFQESQLLHLNSSKAKKLLKWNCKLNLEKNVLFTISWYKSYIDNPQSIINFSLNQIKEFLRISKR